MEEEIGRTLIPVLCIFNMTLFHVGLMVLWIHSRICKQSLYLHNCILQVEKHFFHCFPGITNCLKTFLTGVFFLVEIASQSSEVVILPEAFIPMTFGNNS